MARSIPLLLCGLLQLSAADPTLPDWDACTSIAVGRKASVEGSGMATHNNDCAQCDPRVAFIPARDHSEGSQRPISPFKLEYPRFVGAYRSSTYAPEDGQEVTKPIGFIDEVPHTFAYWEAGYPLLNEHGLGFGESTCGAQLISESVAAGGKALFSVAALMQVALERCKTARCAIETMGEFGVSHGFYGEDPGLPGAGESLTIVDRSETWVFHITGGLSNSSATWVAQRVPDDHVAVVANNFIIQKVNCKDSDNFLCSPNIFSNARKANLCEFPTEEDFSWLRCYGMDVRYYQYNPTMAPIPYYTTLRMWRIQSLANPEAAIGSTDNAFAFPFSIAVSKKVSRTDIMNWTRDYYKDTEFDMSMGILGGPFNNPNRLEGGNLFDNGMSQPGQFARGISIPRTSYSIVVQAKTEPAQSIVWLATDQPLTSVFVPFVASSDQAASSYHVGRLEEFSRGSAFWAFNFVSNWMNINFKAMMDMHVGPAMHAEQQHIMAAVEALEANWPEDKETVNEVQQGLQERLVQRWWKLADSLIWQFSDGMYTFANTTKKGVGYPAWWLQMIGYTDEFYKVQWVQSSKEPPSMLLPSLPAALQPARRFADNFLQLAAGRAPDTSFIPGLVVGLILGGVMASVGRKRSESTPASDMQTPLL